MSGLSSVEACQQIAWQMWSGERTHLSWRLGGLNTEDSVRARLRSVGLGLEEAASLTADLRRLLGSIDFIRDDPLSILERTERAVTTVWPDSVVDLDRFADVLAPHEQALQALLVTQSLAGRMGRWAVRQAELPDAKRARQLMKNVAPIGAHEVDRLLLAANELYRQQKYGDAVRALLEADRNRRSVDVLFKTAFCLWKGGEHALALWAIRMCLLEDIGSFDSPSALLKAQTVEASLATILDRTSLQPAPSQVRLREVSDVYTRVDTLEILAFIPEDDVKLIE